MPVLVERLGAFDLEGVENLPEVMRPQPSQKPQALKDPPEKSEEVRLIIAQLVSRLIEITQPQHFAPYLDEFTNVIRALVMDPSNGNVMKEACNGMSLLCCTAPKLLLHYSEKLARSLFSCLVHKHWKVRKAGLDAIGKVMHCGPYKYNATIMEALIGFRDPNVVPIKDFYEPSTKLNYLAMLVNDRSANVREVFYRVVADWLLRLPDKGDHESRLIPYILAGLFDPIPEIREMCFEQIEEIGQQYEEDNEKDIREIRQLGFQEPWTAEGQMIYLPLPEPFAKRPRLGARLFFRKYVQRYLKPIFSEVSDWISTSREHSSNLLLALIIFTEDYITQQLDKFLTNMYKALLINDSPKVLENLHTSLRLVGRYVPIESYLPQVLPTLRVRYVIYSHQSLHTIFYACLLTVFREMFQKRSTAKGP